MGRKLDEIMEALPPARQARINAHAQELMREYETLQELRKALNITQEQMAHELGVKQENISRLEQRSDMLLSTLARAIDVLGGKLDLTVRFRDRPAVSLSKLVEATAPVRRPPRARAAKRRVASRKSPHSAALARGKKLA
jgi:transcriptional regulator with XRE-family HTH domain